jgi:hypothetical protein
VAVSLPFAAAALPSFSALLLCSSSSLSSNDSNNHDAISAWNWTVSAKARCNTDSCRWRRRWCRRSRASTAISGGGPPRWCRCCCCGGGEKSDAGCMVDGRILDASSSWSLLLEAVVASVATELSAGDAAVADDGEPRPRPLLDLDRRCCRLFSCVGLADVVVVVVVDVWTLRLDDCGRHFADRRPCLDALFRPSVWSVRSFRGAANVGRPEASTKLKRRTTTTKKDG